MGLHRVKPRKPRTYKVASEFGASPHENLAVAIVSQAVNDARALKDGNKVYGNAGGRPVSRWELLNFFRSKWCATLLGTTEINGEDIAKKVGLMILLNDDPIVQSMERTGYAPWMQEDEEEHDDYWSDFEPFAVYEV